MPARPLSWRPCSEPFALIQNEEIVRVFPASTRSVDLPGVGQVSPPVAGWQGAGFRIAALVPFAVPEGQRAIGAPSYALVDGVPIESRATEPDTVDLAAYAADLRWQKETGGTLWNGWLVHTDRESQNKVLAERMAIELGQRTDPDGWKFADGEFRMVSNAEFIALTDAVRSHVRQSFATEAAVLAKIEAALITTGRNRCGVCVMVAFFCPLRWGGVVGPAECEFVSVDSSAADASSYTFSRMDLGLEAPDRVVFAVIGLDLNSATQITSVTIGGEPAVMMASEEVVGNSLIAICAATPLDPAGSVVITANGFCYRCGVSLYRVTGLWRMEPVSSDSVMAPGSFVLNVQKGGFVLAATGRHSVSSNAINWTGVEGDVARNGEGGRQFWTAHALIGENDFVYEVGVMGSPNTTMLAAAFR